MMTTKIVNIESEKMENKPKRVTRPVKPKSVPAKNSVVESAAENSLNASTVYSVDPSTTNKENESATAPNDIVPAVDTTKPKTRIQTNKAIGVNIASARTRRHIDKLN